MHRFGRPSREIGLGSCAGVLFLSVVIAGCSGAAGHTASPQATGASRAASARSPSTQDPASAKHASKFSSLPGRDVHKARDGGGDLREVRFYSHALGRTDSYLIYLPPGYQAAANSGKLFPVLYLLHGDGRNQRHGAGHMFQRGAVGPAAGALMSQGRIQPMLIVIPEAAD